MPAPRDFSYRAASRTNLLRRDYLLTLLAEFLDPERHHVAGFQEDRGGLHAETDAGRGSRDDDVAWLHHEELRAVPHEVLATEDHGLCVSALTLLAIDVEPHVQILRIPDLIPGDEPWPNRSEGLAALALVPLAAAALNLEHTLGNVVAEKIAGDRVLRFVLREIARALADDDAEFDFPVELARLARRDRVVVRAANAARRLVENDRLFRHWHAGFSSVVRIVEPNRNKVTHVADAGAKSRLAGDRLHPLEVCLLDFRKTARGDHFAVDVLHDA